MSAFSPREGYLLDHTCRSIREAFPDAGLYLVGTATERGSYRDVDLRLMLSDDRYDAMRAVMGQEGMAFLGIAIGQYVATLTGLPIDFQIQRQTDANEAHKGKPRHAKGICSLSNFRGEADR